MIPIALKRSITSALGTCLLWALTLTQAQAQALGDIFVAAHPGNTTHALSRDATRAIFAMRQRTWPDGQAIQVFVLPNRHPIHTRFTKEQLNVYPHQLQLAWDRMVFSGMGQAPNRVRDLDEMLEKIATTPGALGYLERTYLDDTIQVISVE
ncbi:hypothetical protein [Vreelandella sp. EE22]